MDDLVQVNGKRLHLTTSRLRLFSYSTESTTQTSDFYN